MLECEADVLKEPRSINTQSRVSADREDMAQIPGSSQSREKLLFARSTTVVTVKGLGKFEGNAAVKGSFE